MTAIKPDERPTAARIVEKYSRSVKKISRSSRNRIANPDESGFVNTMLLALRDLVKDDSDSEEGGDVAGAKGGSDSE